MLYHEISLVSVYGLRGTLYVQNTGDAEGVSVQAEGPYEAKVAHDSWLRIYPEGQEPPILVPPVPIHFHRDMIAGGTHFGAVDATFTTQFLTDSRPGARARISPRVRTRASARARATVQITAPPGTRFELIGCHGLRKGPRGWRSMQGNSRFDIR